MNTNRIAAVGTAVNILSQQGTGRRAGKGQIIGIMATGHLVVAKVNGKRIAIHPNLVEVA